MPKRRRNSLANELIHRALNAPCDYPACACGEKTVYWNDFLSPQGPVLTDEQIEVARLGCACVLACMSRHPRDPDVRRRAIVELLKPTFAAFRWH